MKAESPRYLLQQRTFHLAHKHSNLWKRAQLKLTPKFGGGARAGTAGERFEHVSLMGLLFGWGGGCLAEQHVAAAAL